MSNIAIQVENLGKRYRIGAQERRYKRFTETMMNTLAAPIHRLRRLGQPVPPAETIWALKDVSFEVKEGEVVGIIGRNGAGKSTLLKVLSRITEPTEGEVRVYGRVGSLLEVGTGFHPELTGRENIYLNGAILGMRKAEIERKFDGIVDFAEIEKFIDTPVKRYSSGMYVRLAFAVAAHLEPEILLVDEVLAVGDVAFQRKCLGKMESVAHEGRTVLFVSHNLGAVRQLCPKTILIDKGKIAADAPTEDTLRLYDQHLREGKVDAQTSLHDRLSRTSGAARFTSIGVEDTQGNEKWDFKVGDTIRMKLSYRVFEPVSGLSVYIGLYSGSHYEIVTTVTHVLSPDQLNPGDSDTVIVELPDVFLRPGEYYPYFWLGNSANGAAYDVMEYRNASFPPISVSSEEIDPQKIEGYFSIPARVITAD
jgi:lipopolysaccharide transport system ATP-binding protein